MKPSSKKAIFDDVIRKLSKFKPRDITNESFQNEIIKAVGGHIDHAYEVGYANGFDKGSDSYN